MQILYETPLKYYLLKVNDTDITVQAEHNLEDPFLSLENILQLQKGKIPIELVNFLNSNKKEEEIYVTHESLIKHLKELFTNKFIYDEKLIRKIKENSFNFIKAENYSKEFLSIAHKLANHNLERDEKMDVLVTETLSLIDSLEKDNNIHVMRIKEWYSSHFPELEDVISNNYSYLMAVILVKRRNDFLKKEKSVFLEEIKKFKKQSENWENKFEEIKKVSESSMGSDFSDEDVDKIVKEALSIIHSYDHKEKMEEYLEERVRILAPNLVALLGPMVACRMINSCGNLMNLSKKPSSTLQILGAEKSFFEAVKNKQNTPKYGFIYNSPLVASAPTLLKGKIARTLASKASLAAKIDIFGGDESGNMGKKAAEGINKRIEALKIVKKKKKMVYE